jgi:hypothetical protein
MEEDRRYVKGTPRADKETAMKYGRVSLLEARPMPAILGEDLPIIGILTTTYEG